MIKESLQYTYLCHYLCHIIYNIFKQSCVLCGPLQIFASELTLSEVTPERMTIENEKH